MSVERLALGAGGEKLAADYLRSKGYRIVAVNWRCHMGEIDLIAQKAGVLAICEVKTRSGSQFGHPFEAITPRKKKKLRKLGEYYWIFVDEQHSQIRFDAIAVSCEGKDYKVEHIENAF